MISLSHSSVPAAASAKGSSVAPSLASVAPAAVGARLEVRPHAYVRAVQRDVDLDDPQSLTDLTHGHRARTQDKSGEPSTKVTGERYVIWLAMDGVTVKSVANRF